MSVFDIKSLTEEKITVTISNILPLADDFDASAFKNNVAKGEIAHCDSCEPFLLVPQYFNSIQ